MNKFFTLYWNTIVKRIIRPRYIKRIRDEYKLEGSPSIIASNCIAGEMYNDLGLKFTSPTINLFFREKDFLKLGFLLCSGQMSKLPILLSKLHYQFQ